MDQAKHNETLPLYMDDYTTTLLTRSYRIVYIFAKLTMLQQE